MLRFDKLNNSKQYYKHWLLILSLQKLNRSKYS